MQVLGTDALPHRADDATPADGRPIDLAQSARLTSQYLNFRKASIYAGSNEIQRNIIARTMLGL